MKSLEELKRIKEETLKAMDLRQAKDAWPEMIDAARTSLDIEQFYVSPSTGEPLEAI